MQNDSGEPLIPADGKCQGAGFSVEYVGTNVAYFDQYLSGLKYRELVSVMRSHDEYVCYGCTVATSCRARILVTLRSWYRKIEVTGELPEKKADTTELA